MPPPRPRPRPRSRGRGRCKTPSQSRGRSPSPAAGLRFCSTPLSATSEEEPKSESEATWQGSSQSKSPPAVAEESQSAGLRFCSTPLSATSEEEPKSESESEAEVRETVRLRSRASVHQVEKARPLPKRRSRRSAVAVRGRRSAPPSWLRPSWFKSWSRGRSSFLAEDRGHRRPRIEFSTNAKDKFKTGQPEARINLGISSVCVGREAEPDDVRSVLRQRSEAVVVLSWQPLLSDRSSASSGSAVAGPFTEDSRRSRLRWCLENPLTPWLGEILDGGRGALLYRPNRVESLKVLSSDDVGRYNITTFQVNLAGSAHNNAAKEKKAPLAVVGGRHIPHIGRPAGRQRLRELAHIIVRVGKD